MKKKPLKFLTQVKKSNAIMLANYGLEFSSGIIVGIIFGYFIDKYFNTKPIFIIIFMFLGFIAGLINLRRLINKNKL